MTQHMRSQPTRPRRQPPIRRDGQAAAQRVGAYPAAPRQVCVVALARQHRCVRVRPVRAELVPPPLEDTPDTVDDYTAAIAEERSSDSEPGSDPNVPLVQDSVAIGAIVVGRREVLPFTPQRIALLETFADQAVIAIENARLFSELEQRNQQLSEALHHD